MRTLYFVIPAFNEAKNLPSLFDEIELAVGQTNHKIILVDDGSTDGTKEMLAEHSASLPLIIVTHPRNVGVGAGFRNGYTRLLGLPGTSPDDILVTIEADNTSDLKILPAMISKIDGGADLVLASCYAPGGRVEGTNWWRVILSAGANALIRTLFKMHNVHTYSSFYRVMKLQLLSKLSKTYGSRMIEEPGFICMVELLLKFRRIGARIDEVPMILKGSRRKGASKMRVISTTLSYLKLISRLKLGF